jgi:hypothetical protein
LGQRIDPTVTQHGFRSTFADWRGDRTDFSAEVAEFALAHVKKGVEGAYQPGDVDCEAPRADGGLGQLS